MKNTVKHLPVIHIEQRNGAAHDDFRLSPRVIHIHSSFGHHSRRRTITTGHLVAWFCVGVIISISLAGAGWFVWTLATFVRQLLRGF